MAIETTRGPEAATEMMRTLPGSAYLSHDHFAREAETIFHREWFQVGRVWITNSSTVRAESSGVFVVQRPTAATLASTS